MIIKSYEVEQNDEFLKKAFILFYGQNIGLKDEIKKKIKAIYKNAEINISSQDEIINHEDTFYLNVMNISLFGAQKIFIISQCNDKILKILEKIEDKIDNQKIFLFSEQLDKKSKLRSYFEKHKNFRIVACYEDNEISLKKIITSKLNSFTGLTNHNINVLVDNSGLDRSKLNNEIEKVVTYFKDKKITTAELQELLNIKSNENFNTLKDQAMIGNKITTNKLISDTIIEPEKNILYLNIINQRLIKLLEIIKEASNSNLDNAINTSKPPIFWKDKPFIKQQVMKWDLIKVKKALNKTYRLEIDMKSNNYMHQNFFIKKLLVDICNLANS